MADSESATAGARWAHTWRSALFTEALCSLHEAFRDQVVHNQQVQSGRGHLHLLHTSHPGISSERDAYRFSAARGGRASRHVSCCGTKKTGRKCGRDRRPFTHPPPNLGQSTLRPLSSPTLRSLRSGVGGGGCVWSKINVCSYRPDRLVDRPPRTCHPQPVARYHAKPIYR